MRTRAVLFSSITLLTVTLLVSGSIDERTDKRKVETRDLSSLAPICSWLAGRQTNAAFDIQKFRTCLQQFTTLSREQIQSNFQLKSPEELLALLEAYSNQNHLLNYSQVIDQLSQDELKKINQNLGKFLKLKRIAAKDINELITQIHKLLHPTKGLRDAFGAESPVFTELNKIEREALITKTELSFATRNLYQAFAEFGALRMPNPVGRMRSFLRDHKKNIIRALVLAAFTASAASRGTFPKYLPLFDIFDPEKISQESWTSFKNGEDLEITKKIDRQVRLIFLTRVYNLGARIALIAFLAGELQTHYGRWFPSATYQNQVEAVRLVEAASQRLDPPRVRAELVYDEYLDSLSEVTNQGPGEPSSAENLKFKELVQEDLIAIWEQSP